MEKLLGVTVPHLDCFYKPHVWHFTVYSSHSDCGGEFSLEVLQSRFVSQNVYI